MYVCMYVCVSMSRGERGVELGGVTPSATLHIAHSNSLWYQFIFMLRSRLLFMCPFGHPTCHIPYPTLPLSGVINITLPHLFRCMWQGLI